MVLPLPAVETAGSVTAERAWPTTRLRLEIEALPAKAGTAFAPTVMVKLSVSASPAAESLSESCAV